MLSLRDAGVGCFIGEFFVGALAYADDIVLLAPMACAMHRLLSICDEYSSEYSMLFSANKSKCLIFPVRHRFSTVYEKLQPFVIGGNKTDCVTRWSHLGHVINTQLIDDDDIVARKSQLIGQINSLICNFSKLDPLTRNRLFQAYCTSFYGCQIWDLCNTKLVEEFCIAWRKGMRRVWSLPANTKSDAVYLVAGVIPIFDELCKRLLNFVWSCYRSDSDLVRFVVKHGIDARMNSPLGRNVTFCSLRYGVAVHNFCTLPLPNSFFREHFCKSLSPEFVHKVRCAFELIMIRENVLSVPGVQLTAEDCTWFISQLLT